MTREELLSITIEKTSDEKYQEIKNTLGELEKPVDGLGRFEEIICKIGAIGQTSKPDISNKTLVVMCADNGILEEGVSDVGGYVTGVTAKNMSEGKSLVNLLAENSGINILPIDIGINGDIEGGSLLVNKIAKGDGDLATFLKYPFTPLGLFSLSLPEKSSGKSSSLPPKSNEKSSSLEVVGLFIIFKPLNLVYNDVKE